MVYLWKKILGEHLAVVCSSTLTYQVPTQMLDSCVLLHLQSHFRSSSLVSGVE